MISVGDCAPDFELPMARTATEASYRLAESIHPESVLLVFTPQCLLEEGPLTAASLTFGPWFQFHDRVAVWVVTDEPYALGQNLGADPFPEVPILIDSDRTVAARYGVAYRGEREDESDTAVVLVDPSQTVRFRHDQPLDSNARGILRRTIGQLHPIHTRRHTA